MHIRAGCPCQNAGVFPGFGGPDRSSWPGVHREKSGPKLPLWVGFLVPDIGNLARSRSSIYKSVIWEKNVQDLQSLAWLQDFCRTFGIPYEGSSTEFFYYVKPSTEPFSRTPKVPQNSEEEGGARTCLFEDRLLFLPLSFRAKGGEDAGCKHGFQHPKSNRA